MTREPSTLDRSPTPEDVAAGCVRWQQQDPPHRRVCVTVQGRLSLVKATHLGTPPRRLSFSVAHPLSAVGMSRMLDDLFHMPGEDD